MAAPVLFAGKNYAYGFGRVGVLQEYLLTQQDVERLLAAPDEDRLAHAITELKISTHVAYHADAHRFINNLERWLRKEVRQMVPEDQAGVFDVLWLKSDASLLSYLLKKHHGFTSDISDEPSVGATAFNPEAMRTLAGGGKDPEAPERLARFIESMRAETGLTPQEIDNRVAQFTVDEQLAIARQSGSRSIQLYVAHHIDLQNIRTARRLGKSERPADHLQRGGDIDVDDFSLDKAHLAELVRRSSLPSSLADAIMATETADSSVTLERGLAKAIAQDIAHMRNQVLSIEPIFAFAAVALSQFKVLRTLLIGKTTGLSIEGIRKLLPPFLSTSPFAS